MDHGGCRETIRYDVIGETSNMVRHGSAAMLNSEWQDTKTYSKINVDGKLAVLV